jgi:hypothetical protein
MCLITIRQCLNGHYVGVGVIQGSSLLASFIDSTPSGCRIPSDRTNGSDECPTSTDLQDRERELVVRAELQEAFDSEDGEVSRV